MLHLLFISFLLSIQQTILPALPSVFDTHIPTLIPRALYNLSPASKAVLLKVAAPYAQQLRGKVEEQVSKRSTFDMMFHHTGRGLYHVGNGSIAVLGLLKQIASLGSAFKDFAFICAGTALAAGGAYVIHRLNTLETKVDTVDGKLNTLDAKVDIVDGKLNTVQGTLEAFSEQTLQGFGLLNFKIDEQHSELKGLMGGLRKGISRVEEAQESLGESVLQLRKEGREIASQVNSTLAEHGGQLSSIEQTQGQHGRTLEELKTGQINLAEQIREQANDIVKQTELLQGLLSEIGTLDETLQCGFAEVRSGQLEATKQMLLLEEIRIEDSQDAQKKFYEIQEEISANNKKLIEIMREMLASRMRGEQVGVALLHCFDEAQKCVQELRGKQDETMKSVECLLEQHTLLAQAGDRVEGKVDSAKEQLDRVKGTVDVTAENITQILALLQTLPASSASSKIQSPPPSPPMGRHSLPSLAMNDAQLLPSSTTSRAKGPSMLKQFLLPPRNSASDYPFAKRHPDSSGKNKDQLQIAWHTKSDR